MNQKTSKYPEKIYVSRSHLIDNGGVAGEVYIENILQEYEGFFILKPEQYSLYEQMNYYRHAKICIFAEGSAIHGLELIRQAKQDNYCSNYFKEK